MTTQDPAAPPTPTPNPEPTPTPSPSPSDWLSSIDDADLKGFVETKGFQSAKALAESYRNLEKLQGVPQERLLQLPESLEGEDANPVWEKLGWPKEPNDYQIEVPEEIGDKEMADWAKQTFHKLRIPRNQAEQFVKAWNERQTNMSTEMKAQIDQEFNNQQESLKKEWGAAFEQNKNIANQVAAKLEITQAQVEALGGALGPAQAMKFLHGLGEKIGEAEYINGSGDGNKVNSPDQAKSEIKQLISDKDFQRRLASGDTDAKNKWNRLHQQASPGQLQL